MIYVGPPINGLTLESGLHPDVPAEVYFACEAASNSRLTDLRKTPAHCRHRIDNPDEPTEALTVGDAFHAMVLLPESFDQRYVVCGPCSARTVKDLPCRNTGSNRIGGKWLCGTHVKRDRYDEALEAQKARMLADGWKLATVSDHRSMYFTRGRERARVSNHPAPYRSRLRMIREGSLDIRVDRPPYGNDDPRTVLDPRQHETCVAMREAVLANKKARALLEADGVSDATGCWRDKETGQPCKLRTDRLVPGWRGGATVLDFKTTDDASKEAFTRSVIKYGYDRQAAWYLDGLAAMGHPYEHFVFVVVEKDPPHGVALYSLEQADLGYAREVNRQLLASYARCSEAGVWPAYPDRVQTISLPYWRQTQEGSIESE